MDRSDKYVGYKDAGKDFVKMCSDAIVGLMIKKKPTVDYRKKFFQLKKLI